MAFIAAFSRAILVFVAAHQYAGLFGFLLIEEAGVPLPLPGDTLIMYAGVRSRHGETIAAVAILLVALAATLGSSALYWLARRGGRAALARYGRVLHLRHERVDRMEARFRRWGIWAIILGRLMPGLRTPTTVMAGLFAVPYRVFAPCTAVSALLWSLAYFYLGALFARQWRRALLLAARDLDATIGIALVIGTIVLLVVALRRGHPRNAAAHPLSREATER